MTSFQSWSAIIFDMDGVLVDSTPAHARAFAEVLAPYKIPVDYREIAGMRTKDALRRLFKENQTEISDSEIEVLATAKSVRARELLSAELPYAPECLETLVALGARYPLALATSASEGTVEVFFGGDKKRFFRHTIHGGQVRYAKPDPEIYRLAADALNVPAAECLVVEDSIAGVRAGKAAGATVCGVIKLHSADELYAAGADFVVRTLPELLSIAGGAQMHGQPIDSRQWTALIPAAGRGSRLGFHLPKILYPVAGKTILNWLFELLGPYCSEFVFVLSPDGAPIVEPVLADLMPGRYRVAIQANPAGMADAISVGLECVRTPYLSIIWGDQPGVRRETVESCLRLMATPDAPLAVVPTVSQSPPYIHFERDHRGRVCRVLQAREGDVMPSEGQSDSGIFFFQTELLRRFVARVFDEPQKVGAVTGELNFLPILADIDQETGRLLMPAIVCPEEAVGVNTPSDAAQLARVLSDEASGAINDGNNPLG